MCPDFPSYKTVPLSLGLIRANERVHRRRSFFQSILQKPALLHLRVLLLPFIVLLQNKHTTLAENIENLISVQPRIRAHLE